MRQTSTSPAYFTLRDAFMYLGITLGILVLAVSHLSSMSLPSPLCSPLLNVLVFAHAGPAPLPATNVGTTNTSTFSLHCPGVSTIPSVEWAIDSCHTKGGWLATPQSHEDDVLLRNLVTAVTGSPGDYILIGGSDAWVETNWVWMDGPEAGRLFYNGVGYPSPGNGQVIGHRYVPPQFVPEKDGTGSSGDWMVQFGSATSITWGDVSTFASTQCYACQYQLCTNVCNSTHTASHTGLWWPDCVCTCNPGWRGQRCDIQFTSHCTADQSVLGSTAGAIADCHARGGYLASPQSRDEDDAIVSLGNVSVSSYVIIDGTDSMKESSWRFLDGPYKDELFWVGNSVATGGGPAKSAPWEAPHYNHFHAAEPEPPSSSTSGIANILWEHKVSDTVPSEFTWGDFPITGSVVQCYACQYAYCSQVCNMTNTEAVSGTEWPNCTCTCKASWGGPRCSEKLIETPTSNITVRCPGAGNIPDMEWAIDRCHSYGGWLATPQRSEEYDAILAFAHMYSTNPVSTNYTLLGGSDAWYETHWVWSDGPEIGRQFWLGNLPSYYSASGTGHPIGGRYAPPYFLPEQEGTGSSGDYMVFGPSIPYNYTVGDLGDGTTYPFSRIQCYACMFQLCTNVCNATHTASFTGEMWPNCGCTCNPGWRGERCDIQFSTHCTSDHSALGNVTTPIAECHARGGYLASPQNHIQDDSLQSLGNISKVTYLLLSGSDEEEEGVWRWLDGPEKGEVFWRGYSPAAGYTPITSPPWMGWNTTVYANFESSQPEVPSALYTGNYVIYWQTSFVSFMWGDFPVNESKTSCYACQYTACADYCNATTTSSFTGLEWPSCACNCLPGWAGPKCQCRDLCHTTGTLSTYLNYTDQNCGCTCSDKYRGAFCNISTATLSLTSTLPNTTTLTHGTPTSSPNVSTPSGTREATATSNNRTATLTLLSPTNNRTASPTLLDINRTATPTIPLKATQTASLMYPNTTTPSISHTTNTLSPLLLVSTSPPRNDSTVTSTLPSTSLPPRTLSATLADTNQLSHTATHSITTPPPNINTINTTLASMISASLPLSAPIHLSDASVVVGSDTITTASQPLDALLAILGSSGSGTSSRAFEAAAALTTVGYNVPIVSMQPRTSGSISGNPNGYFATQPTSVRVSVNATHVRLSMSAIDNYIIDAEEELELHTTLRTLYWGSTSLVDTSGLFNLDATIVVMTVVATPSSTMGAGALPTTTTIVVVGGGFSGMASEVQALGAFAMMSCADPRTRSNFGSYRILAPTALTESYSGVVLGNAVLIIGVAIVQIIILGLLRAYRSISRLIDLMATCMFPSLTLIAASAFHVGTAFASSQLVSEPNKYDTWEVAVGAVGMVYCVLYPLLLTLHPYLRVGRAYQEYEMTEWLISKKWPSWTTYIIPRGAIFSVETRRAYGPAYISSIRLPARQVWWVSMPAWTGTIVAVGGLIHPVTVPHCQALFIIMGILLIATGVIVIAFRPLRADVASVLSGASRTCSGVAIICMAAALNDSGPTDTTSLTAILAISIVLMVIAVLHIVFALVGWYVEYRMNSDNVPLSLVWTHIPGSSNKATQQFTVAGDQEMLVVAGARDLHEDNLDGNEKTTLMIKETAAIDLLDTALHNTTPSSSSSISVDEDEDAHLGSSTRHHPSLSDDDGTTPPPPKHRPTSTNSSSSSSLIVTTPSRSSSSLSLSMTPSDNPSTPNEGSDNDEDFIL